jgi:hypothetical protein
MKIRLVDTCRVGCILSLLFLGFTIRSFAEGYPLYAGAAELYANASTYDLSQETYSTSELWRVAVQTPTTGGSLYFLADSYHSPVVTPGENTYVVLVEPDHRPKIARLNGGVSREAFIDPVLYQPDEFYVNSDSDATNDLTDPDYYRFRFEDAHHTIAVGIDELGYIHVVGDMHNYPWINDHDHLPLRYTGQYCMYWRSAEPLFT